MSDNESIPPSFTPKNRNTPERRGKTDPIIVGKNNPVRHSSDHSRSNRSANIPPSITPRSGKRASSNDSVPPSYTPLSDRRNKPTSYNAKNISSGRKYTSASSSTANLSSQQPRAYTSSANNSQYPSSGINHIGQNGRQYQNSRFSDSGNSNGFGTLPSNPKSRKKKVKKIAFSVLTVLVLLCVVWPSYLFYRASSQMTSVDALSNMPKTSEGTTWLIAGSDSRSNSHIQDKTLGERSDSIIMVHKAPNGQASMISLPRDTLARIPGYDLDKLNSSFSYGGPKLLVQTVEGLTNTKIDHYVQIGMNGVENLVNAVNGVNLCLNYDVNDIRSELVWKSGCHDADGKTALAFARMRYADPMGDIGRADRQRQVISKLMNKVFTPSVMLNPFTQLSLVDSGSQSVKTDSATGPFDIGTLALAFRKARNENISGAPPISSMNYMLLSGASTVLLDPDKKDNFFKKMREGTLTPDDFQKFG